MKSAVSILVFIFVATAAHAQEKITLSELKYLLSPEVKNKDLDSIVLKLGYGFKKIEKWPAQTNLHYHNKYSKSDKRYSTLDVSILLLDDNKFYISYTSRSMDDIQNILKEVVTDSAYKSNNVYLSHYNQADQFLGKEYKNEVYSIGSMKFDNKTGVDYSVFMSLNDEYKKTIVLPSPQ
jgi:hypothetical protein